MRGKRYVYVGTIALSLAAGAALMSAITEKLAGVAEGNRQAERTPS